jgi:hypothetical protein
VKRWSFDSIASTIALTVVVAMGLGFALQHVVDSGLKSAGLSPDLNWQNDDVRFYMALFPARAASLLEVLDATPDPDRPPVIAAVQGPKVRAELLAAPLPHLVDSTDQNALALLHRIDLYLAAPHVVIVAPKDQQASDPKGSDPAKSADDGQSGMLVEAPLRDGHWLVLTTNVEPPPLIDPATTEYYRASLGLWLTLSAVLVVLLSVLSGRRLANPFRGSRSRSSTSAPAAIPRPCR